MSEINILLRATDQASAMIGAAGASISGSLDQVDASAKRVAASSAQAEFSFKSLATGIAGIATSAFNLYNAYDRVADMQVSLDRANLQVTSTLNSLNDAQIRYNTAVEKYGADSEQAKAAAADLQLAQERYTVAVERANMIQGNLNETIVQSGISLVTTSITMADSISRVITQFERLNTSGGTLSTTLGKLGGSLGGTSTASADAANGIAGTGIAATSTAGKIGELATGFAGVTAMFTIMATGSQMAAQRLDEMKAKGAEVTDMDYRLAEATNVLGSGMSMTLAQGLLRALGLYNETDEAVKRVTNTFIAQNATVQQAVNRMAELGMSKEFIDKVTASMVALGAQGSSSMNNLTGAVNGATDAVKNAQIAVTYFRSDAIANMNALNGSVNGASATVTSFKNTVTSNLGNVNTSLAGSSSAMSNFGSQGVSSMNAVNGAITNAVNTVTYFRNTSTSNLANVTSSLNSTGSAAAAFGNTTVSNMNNANNAINGAVNTVTYFRTQVTGNFGTINTAAQTTANAINSMKTSATSSLSSVQSSAYSAASAFNSLSYSSQQAANQVKLANATIAQSTSPYVGGTPIGGYYPVYAEGGLVTQPTFALVGEAGPELIIPLDKIARAGPSEMNSPPQYVTVNPTINIGNISSELDLAEVTRSVNRGIADAVRRRL